ncbi:MAG: hypothetical protein ACLR9T_05880 [Thomasclavelia sp.]|uniref:hypothetical protein n=1 Tax=Thomasclavelia sp. TaxID=3025757 RepID=UPI0039A36D81
MKKKMIFGFIAAVLIIITVFIFNKTNSKDIQNGDKQSIEEGSVPQQNFEDINESNNEKSNQNLDQNKVNQDENLDSFGDNEAEIPWNLTE